MQSALVGGLSLALALKRATRMTRIDRNVIGPDKHSEQDSCTQKDDGEQEEKGEETVSHGLN
jgi:hypothetical protein